MKDEQTKGAIIQWLVPSAVLVIVVIIMLFNFSDKSSQSAEAEVENSIINIAEKYAAKINHEFICMASAGRPVAHLLEKKSFFDTEGIAEMLLALNNNCESYAAVFSNGKGQGIRHDSAKVDLSKSNYYEKLLVRIGEEDSLEEEAYKVRFIHVEEDGIGFGREAIVAVIYLNKEADSDMLLLYYPIEQIHSLVKKTEFDADVFYALMDEDGNIYDLMGEINNYSDGTNLWTLVTQSSEYKDSVSRATARIKNRIPGSFSALVGGEAKKLVYSPIGINNWTLVVGINQEYIDSMQNREWSNTKQMIYQLVIAILVFLGLVVVINIINKIKSSEKRKELEQKADTDLLTGLHNKLATERKIKEYMANHPDEQAMMFVLDIDNFKKINDTLGHAFGDEVLRCLGHQIGAVFRATDVIGRTGGDEFTIFLKYLNDDQLISKEARKLCQFFKSFQAGEYVKYAATASIGAAVYPRDGKDFESLYKAADNALYMAKKRGKNQLSFYGEDVDKSEIKVEVEKDSKKE